MNFYKNKLNTSFNSQNCQTAAIAFLLSQTNVSPTFLYTNMVTTIFSWLNGPSPNTYTGTTVPIPGLRIQVIDADGSVAMDTYKGILDNTYDNYINNLINENQNTRTYNIGAIMSNTGTFIQTKYSRTVNSTQMYLAIREGFGSDYPVGNVVISMNVNTLIS